MQKFRKLTGFAAPFPLINVDTDMIIPKQFLKTIKRSGLGKNLFHELRYDLNGNLRNDFILNWEPYNKASILIAGENFGCGSSREHAPWSLLDFGFRSIIAPSFADIFFNNCFKNGILPIKLCQKEVDALMEQANEKKKITINLTEQTVKAENSLCIPFNVDSFRKNCLINGLDDIGLTLKKTEKISQYEKNIQNQRAWMFK